MESFYNKYQGDSLVFYITRDEFVDCDDGDAVNCILVQSYSKDGAYLVDFSTPISDLLVCIEFTGRYFVTFNYDYCSGNEMLWSSNSQYLKSLEDYLNTDNGMPFEDKLKAIIHDMHERFSVLVNKPFA